MKKVVLSLFTVLSILAGSQNVAIARTHNTNESFKVRFRENTLVVTSPEMTEARLYTSNGKLLNKEQGKIAQFEIENRGNYMLYAKVQGKTVVRKVVMK
ncbi:MAG: hypothetical protein IKO66_05525 [Paludibacteraceae bacterium]|nr:hypothetical protein [Paludibacteraceae bacterium]